jgi:hypothetical protein
MSARSVSKRTQKLRARIEQNPKHIRFEDLDKLLHGYGFIVRQPRGGSSHYVYKRDQWLLTVPYRRPHIREHYVKEAPAYIEEIEALEDKGTQQADAGPAEHRGKEEKESGKNPDSLKDD